MNDIIIDIIIDAVVGGSGLVGLVGDGGDSGDVIVVVIVIINIVINITIIIIVMGFTKCITINLIASLLKIILNEITFFTLFTHIHEVICFI